MIILEGQNDIYMPVQQLSQGSGQAKVYICENQDGNRFVAKIYSDLDGAGNRIRRFLYQTQNPYLIKLLDHGVVESQGHKCIFEILEYMPGGTLTGEAPMDEYEVEKTVIASLNEALHGMHEEGFLHRDVKSDNLYRSTLEDGRACVKLGDFGISVPVGEDGTYCDAALAFTPGYVPAEVLGSGMYSAASDYYGMAVTIYFLLTGKQIYEGLSPDEIMIRTRRGELMHYEGISRHMASLLEGLTVQDPRYRWGYKEVKGWLSGASVPVFCYSQEEQILDPPYQLTAQISCSSLRQLAQALSENTEEGKKHLYEGLISDSLRRRYQHLANALADITVNRFPHGKNAGLAAAIHTICPDFDGFVWNGTVYRGMFPLLEDLQKEVVSGTLSAPWEELIDSGILSYYYGPDLSDEDRELLHSVEQEALQRPLTAACKLIVGLEPKPAYQPASEVKTPDMDAYIDFLAANPAGFKEQVYQDFNRTYFQIWLGATGYGAAFREWRDFFYKGGKILQNARLTGNVCQFLERICPEKKEVLRRFVIRELKSRPEYWLKNHLDLYDTDEMMQHMLQESFYGVKFTEEMSIPQLMHAQHELKECMNELRRDFLNNPWLYQMGVYDVTDFRIVSKKTEAYFVQTSDGEYVPAGWLQEGGGLQEKTMIQKGFAGLQQEAVAYLNQFTEKLHGWAERCRRLCEEKKQKRQAPGVVGAVLSLLICVLLLTMWSALSGNFLQGSGLLTKVGFMLTFLSIVLCAFASVRRLDQFRLWKRMLRSIENLESMGKEAVEMRNSLQTGSASMEEEWYPSAANLEMEAQKERACSGYIGTYKRLKNGLFRFYLIFLLAGALLAGGLYMDGDIRFDGGGSLSQITDLFNRREKPQSDKDRSDPTLYQVSVSSARLRSGAGTDYAVLNSYEKGTEVKQTGKSQSDGSHIWYQVTTPDGSTGWMRDDTITKK